MLSNLELPSRPSISDVSRVVDSIQQHPHELLVQPDGSRLVDWDALARVDQTPEAVEAAEISRQIEHDPLVRACRYIGKQAVELGALIHSSEHDPSPRVQRSPAEVSFAGLHRASARFALFR